jgi:hypothetical protein
VATIQIFNAFKEAVAEKVHNLQSDTLKVALTDTAPSLANAVLEDIAQVAATGGYAPATATVVSSAQSGGTYTLTLDNVVFTASGGSIGPFRYFVLYNDTTSGKNLIGFGDYGVEYTATDGGPPFTISAGAWLQYA